MANRTAEATCRAKYREPADSTPGRGVELYVAGHTHRLSPAAAELAAVAAQARAMAAAGPADTLPLPPPLRLAELDEAA